MTDDPYAPREPRRPDPPDPTAPDTREPRPSDPYARDPYARDPYAADRPTTDDFGARERFDPYEGADDPYARRGSRPEGRRPPPQRGSPPWPMIIGVAALGVLAVAMAIIVFGGDGEGTGASPSPSASVSASASASAVPSASTSAGPSTSAAPSTPGPTPTPISLELDSIVAATVNDLSVRSGPSTGDTRLGSIASGTPAFVVDGPVDAGGYRWFLLSALGLPPNTGCAGPFETDPFNCPAWFGWVASASQDGVPWLTQDAGDSDECPPTAAEYEDFVIGYTDLMRLHCFGSDPFTFRGYWPEIPDDAGLGGACVSQDEPSGWLICQNVNYNGVVIDEEQGFGGIGLNVSIDPASGVTMPERGTWIELTVHLDDPAAQGCGDDAQGADAEERTPEQIVLFCRGQMVVESVSTVAGP